jgi:hypothetical protein
LVTWKKAAAFIVTRRKKSRRKAAEKPLNGQKSLPTDKKNSKIRVHDNQKNGFLDMCVGKPTDFVQDWVRGF